MSTHAVIFKLVLIYILQDAVHSFIFNCGHDKTTGLFSVCNCTQHNEGSILASCTGSPWLTSLPTFSTTIENMLDNIDMTGSVYCHTGSFAVSPKATCRRNGG